MAIIELDTKEISGFLKSFGPRLEKSINTRKAVTESALLVASRIKKRTLAGKDVDSKLLSLTAREVEGGRPEWTCLQEATCSTRLK